MKNKPFANPLTIFFLTLPYGISAGFVSVALPYLLVQKGFTVQTTAAITAIGVSANIWRFAWAPLTDLTLTLHTWYKIGVLFCTISLLALVFIPMQASFTSIIMAVVFVSQIAATFVVAPVGSFMANAIEENKKGKASGFFQAAYTGGMGIGGGVGIWLLTHISYALAYIIICISIVLCTFSLYFVPKTITAKTQTVKQGFQSIFLGIKELLHSPIAVFTTALFLSPFASGAAAYMWSSVAHNWQVNSNTVALFTGVLSGAVSALGSIIGGYACDKLGHWWVYFSAGILLALVTLLLSVLPFNTNSYTGGVLGYALFTGVAFAGFSAAILKAIGTNLSATKYALISSLGNIPIVYMTSFNGWLHDNYSVRIMLVGEGILGIVFAVIFILALSYFKIKQRDEHYTISQNKFTVI